MRYVLLFASQAWLLSRRFLGCFLRIVTRLRRKTFHPAPTPIAVSLDPSSPPLESIFQSVISKNSRIIGMTGVEHDNGVSTIARALTRRFYAGGKRALLVDASFTSSSHTPDDEPSQTVDGYDWISLRPTSDHTMRMRDLTALRKVFSTWLQRYDVVIVDMTPPLPDPKYPLPATVLTKVCDSVMLVCLTGRVTHTELQHAVTALRGTAAPLLGVIVNHREQPTLGAEIAREAERIRRFAPGLASRIQSRVGTSKFLNIHA